MEHCSEPFEPDLDDASGGKVKTDLSLMRLFGIGLQPAHFFGNGAGFLFNDELG